MKGLILVALLASSAQAITVNPASAVTADSENTPFTIPYRDASGNFAVGTQTSDAIISGTGSFSGSVTASSVTAQTAIGIGAGVAASKLDLFNTGATQASGLQIQTHGARGPATEASAMHIWTNSPNIYQTFGDGTGYSWVLGRASDSGATKYMVYKDDTGLGIGTASPCSTCTLHVAGGASVTGGLGLGMRTKANFDAANGVVGQSWLCTDCTIPYSVCVGTGTTLSGWKVSHSATVGCGSNN